MPQNIRDMSTDQLLQFKAQLQHMLRETKLVLFERAIESNVDISWKAS